VGTVNVFCGLDFGGCGQKLWYSAMSPGLWPGLMEISHKKWSRPSRMTGGD
jgi:hypothetical protein